MNWYVFKVFQEILASSCALSLASVTGLVTRGLRLAQHWTALKNIRKHIHTLSNQINDSTRDLGHWQMTCIYMNISVYVLCLIFPILNFSFQQINSMSRKDMCFSSLGCLVSGFLLKIAMLWDFWSGTKEFVHKMSEIKDPQTNKSTRNNWVQQKHQSIHVESSHFWDTPMDSTNIHIASYSPAKRLNHLKKFWGSPRSMSVHPGEDGL